MVETQTLDIGSKLKAIRGEKRISLRTLAKLSGLSVNTLSLIERNITSPTVNTLSSISRALGVKINYFFDEQRIEEAIFSKRDQRKEVETKDKGIRLETLGSGLIQQGLEAYVISASKGAKSGTKGVSHLGDELAFCLRGKFQFEVKREKYTLEEGDSLLFKGSLPQQWENMGGGDSVLLIVRGMEK
ncbi:MAG: helix-turn-helix domain-containing protein [Deltaproteobacteria bacterium]|nr:helix-turn-helix domain-containing protein [Deltaproteobacteria bacterium]